MGPRTGELGYLKFTGGCFLVGLALWTAGYKLLAVIIAAFGFTILLLRQLTVMWIQWDRRRRG